jgi:hypothetical protein
MKKIVLAAVAASLVTPAFAGGMAPVAVEPAVVAEDAASSSAGGYVIPLLFLLLLALAASQQTGG